MAPAVMLKSLILVKIILIFFEAVLLSDYGNRLTYPKVHGGKTKIPVSVLGGPTAFQPLET